jgi:hypothetical protein
MIGHLISYADRLTINKSYWKTKTMALTNQNRIFSIFYLALEKKILVGSGYADIKK